MKFETEKASIEYFISILQGKGYTDITTTDPFCYYDIQAKKDDKIYRFELKRRNVNYGDMIMENYKYQKFLTDTDYDFGYLVSFFDNYWAMEDVKKPIGSGEKTARHTTDFEDRRLVTKKFIYYGQTKRFSY